ncbi:MAG: MoxR family ATPase [Gammaproteobacteria bacterium]|nr:MoxR family ATPase [Gammaproteobacteria bacterium]MXW46372.1 MoxR family ATPase [Gammaproteobacteria bacterium]MYD01243.1 MoxR family ATPase [Gammaproteobacteria bacterium]MYI26371.1 MoxR family ATPase [Gammaproteobacteria bacterium]
MTATPDSVEQVGGLLEGQDYIAGDRLSTAVFLALSLRRPLFLEGEAGVGKTELGVALAAALGRRLIRLQCHEGLDLAGAAYEWNHARQILAIRLAEAEERVDEMAKDLYSREYLIERPLLEALSPFPEGPPVLLVDELDRADEPFEAYLLEFLSDFRMSIPELGEVRAPEAPVVVLTSNRTREVHDALKRRCLYCWVDYPTQAAEERILQARVPGLPEVLRAKVAGFVQGLRKEGLFKSPGVSETLDWAESLMAMGAREVDTQAVSETLGALLKYQEDLEQVDKSVVDRLLAASA